MQPGRRTHAHKDAPDPATVERRRQQLREAQRRFRERARKGQCLARVLVTTQLVDWLEAGGFLSNDTSIEAVEFALNKALAEVMHRRFSV